MVWALSLAWWVFFFFIYHATERKQPSGLSHLFCYPKLQDHPHGWIFFLPLKPCCIECQNVCQSEELIFQSIDRPCHNLEANYLSSDTSLFPFCRRISELFERIDFDEIAFATNSFSLCKAVESIARFSSCYRHRWIQMSQAQDDWRLLKMWILRYS